MNTISTLATSPAEISTARGGETAFWVRAENKMRVRELLAREIAFRCELPVGAVQIVSSAGKKPAVKIVEEINFRWNVSLSDTKACCVGALSFGREIGIDVEWIDEAFNWKPVAEEFFPGETVDLLNHLSPSAARRKFFQQWTRWEAALKCRGTGFLSGHQSVAMAELGLTFSDLDLGARYAGCLALG